MTAALMLLVLCAVGCLSVTLSARTRCAPSAAPAVVLGGGMVLLSLAGCAGLLRAGGWLFFAAAAAAAVLEIKNKGRGLRRGAAKPRLCAVFGRRRLFHPAFCSSRADVLPMG